ncbi:MAG: M28 family peptidase, partial [Prevotellaceae bacterium]|nr:M28 family peptidase [Prevotellaceae bacterium]
DSAYFFVKKQVDFGARVPQTEPHKRCAEFLAETLKNFGAEVEVQRGQDILYNGKNINIRNIIGKFNSNARRRILLCSHWDSRPFADRDKDESKRKTAVPGANDGASGVGVLMEIARNLKFLPENLGVDIVFFDVEDYGAPEFYTGNSTSESWCIGSKFWAQEAKKSNYNAQFGILLDMVGAPAARFYKEIMSQQYAANIVEKVWDRAQLLGFDGYFVAKNGGAITDDHLNINTIAHIPCIDIIHYEPNSPNGFGAYWHTTQDDMRNINKNTLFVVGTTVLNVVFGEK